MTTFTASLDLAAALAPPDACPACGAAPLAPVRAGAGLDFACPACRRRWHLELGRVREVGAAGRDRG